MENEITKTDLWRMAAKSRFFFPTYEESEQLIRRKVKDITAITDPQANEDIYERFNAYCQKLTGYGLDLIMKSYLYASSIYEKKDSPWEGKKSDVREKMALGIFALAYLKNNSVKEAYIRRYFKDSEHKVRFFLTNDCGVEGVIDNQIVMSFLVLLVYRVIKPFLSYSKPRDITTKDYLDKFGSLLKRLDTDLPVMGALKRHPLILESIDKVKKSVDENCLISQATIWDTLDRIGETINNVSSPEELSKLSVESVPALMNGIWVDNGGIDEQFWIFPSNYKMAFCYTKISDNWTLTPYEFALFYDEDTGELTGEAMLITPKGNEDILSEGVAETEESVIFEFDWDVNDEDELVNFRLRLNLSSKPWLTWSAWQRLDKSDRRYSIFRNILEELYPSNEMLADSHLVIRQKWMINMVNALIGMDQEYIYLSTLRIPSYYRLIENNSNEEFTYEAALNIQSNFRNIEVSPEYPLYIIPRQKKYYSNYKLTENYKERFDLPTIIMNSLDDISKDDKDRIRAAAQLFDKFAECACHTTIDDQITIYKIGKNKFICFNRFSVRIDERDVEDYGIIKLTDKSQIWE